MMEGRTDGCGDGGVSKTVTVRLLIVVGEAATSKKAFDGDVTNELIPQRKLVLRKVVLK